uniref:Secreted protein n=1 Tax=Zea mays TaxID=4577 RepID=C0HH78_MAIZE|nr:unknown [Zea mays]
MCLVRSWWTGFLLRSIADLLSTLRTDGSGSPPITSFRSSLSTLSLECFGEIGECVNPQYIKYSFNISQFTLIRLITRIPTLGLSSRTGQTVPHAPTAAAMYSPHRMRELAPFA